MKSLLIVALLLFSKLSSFAQENFPSPYRGDYVGPLIQESVDGQRRTGEARLEIDANGRIFGVIASDNQLGTPFHLTFAYAPVSGKVDSTGRGFIRFQLLDPVTSQISRDPSAEKIPLGVRRGEYLVGGSIDAQGTATSFRAYYVMPL